MSWLASIESESGSAVIFVGKYVDVFSDAIFEGAWAGNFDESNFDRAATVFGSGVVYRDDTYTFVPPSHSLENLYYDFRPNRLVVSNSLPFLISFLDFSPEYDRHFGSTLTSLVRGIDACEIDILTDPDGSTISRLVHKNLVLSSVFRIETKAKPTQPAITDFSTYKDLLRTEMDSAFENARHPHRVQEFMPVATCSSGYDSAAGTVLSAELGCEEALTLATARGGTQDNGRTVANSVGVVVRECRRLTASELGDDSEAEFFATGMGGEDFALKALEPWLPRRMLITGFRGDVVWGRNATPRVAFEGGDVSGCSLGEFRLRVGFVHVPFTSIGARQHARIHAITESAEMEPYRIGGSYDRPIPRRIAEEAGVPREAFGREKRAVSVLFHDRPDLMSRAMLDRAKRLERQQFDGSGALTHKLRKFDHWLRYYAARGARKCAKLLEPRGNVFRQIADDLVGDFRTYEHNNPRSFFDFLAGVERIRDRYSLPDK